MDNLENLLHKWEFNFETLFALLSEQTMSVLFKNLLKN